jgi:hypothetical protein
MRAIGGLRLLVMTFALTFGMTSASFARVGPGPDVPEPGSVEEIAKATTASQFLSPWVSYLPASPGSESRRSAPVVERDIELAGHSRAHGERACRQPIANQQ